MPFSSTPVFVNPDDNVQIRYPTPSGWNEQVTVQVKIGTGTDPDGVTFGTKIPDVIPAGFTFNDMVGYTNAYDGNANQTLTGIKNVFERNTTYYSNLIAITDIEAPVVASISAKNTGPKNAGTANTTAQFRIFRNNSFDSWRSTISANLAAGTGGLQPGDLIQLRVTTPDWYITWVEVTFSVNESTVGGGLPAAYVTAGVSNTAITQRKWNISTRPQDQSIPQSEITFTDRVDMIPFNQGGDEYFYYKVDITEIDTDTVLRVSTSGQTRVVKVEGGGTTTPTTGYTTSLTGVVLNDDVWVRIPNGTDYTEKESGVVTVFATSGDTYTRGSSSYENVSSGTTYGSGTYAVSQTLGSVTDNWQVWTEVDRYPDAITATPIFTYGIKTQLGFGGQGFNYTGTFDTTTTGSGSGMKVKLLGGGQSNSSFTNILGSGGKNTIFISDPGYGYNVGDQITVLAPTPGPTNNATFTLLEYEKVTVSKTTTATCEPGFMYFVDMPVSGLGTEYTTGTYNDLESPYTNLGNNSPSTAQSLVSQLNGQTVKIKAIIDGTGGEIRKNNTGAWSVNEVIVENGDVINLKLAASSTFSATNTAKVRMVGPTQGNPIIGNPTGGPSATFPDKQTTLTLQSRSRRVIPYPFHADPVFVSNPGQEHIAAVSIEGLDVSTNASITSGIGDLSTDQSNWNSTITIQPTDTTLYVRTNASNSSGGITQLSYKIYKDGQEVFDTFRIYTRLFSATLGNFGFIELDGAGESNWQLAELPYYAVEDFYVTLVGAGGGRGGDDAPNSYGGGGGAGNFLRVRVQKPAGSFPDQVGFPGVPDGRLKAYAPDKGNDGANFVQGGGGGTGGFGYAYGGDGGNSGNGDKSGAGGGGGGAAGLTMWDGTLIAMAGGGGGGAGAGNDTSVPSTNAFGNYNSNYGNLQTVTTNINQGGDDAPDATGQGAGPGGGGGGYNNTAGALLTQKLDANNNVIQTTDLDATAGTGGGGYYNSSDSTVLSSGVFGGFGAAPGSAGKIIIEYSPQDTLPNAFSFDTVDGAQVSSQVISNRTQITGITGKVSIQLNSPGFTSTARVCSLDNDASCGAWGATTIGNGEYLQIRATTGTGYFTPYTTTVEVGDGSAQWIVNTGPPPDTSPNFYDFADVDPAAINSLIVSETVTISGINVPVQVTASNGAEVNINNSGWVSGSSLNPPTILNGQSLQVRITSSPDYSTTVNTTITVGTGSQSTVVWSVKTLAEVDTLPNGFSWLDVDNANLNTTYTSNVNKIEGLGGPTYFQVVSDANDQSADPATAQLPIILLGGIEQLDSNNNPLTYVQIENLDQLSLKYTTTGVLGEPRVFETRTGGIYNSTSGLVEGTENYPVFITDWKVTTAGSFTANPNQFTFSTQVASGPNTDTNSVEVITISGLGQVTPIVTTNGLRVSINGGTFNPSDTGQYSINNGQTIQVQLKSSVIPGFTRTGQIQIGNYVTSFSVQTPASVQDPIESQWYSSIQPVKYIGNVFSGDQIRFDTKFDGLPIGTMIPVFQDGTQDDNWGDLEGSVISRFPGMLYCDGSYVDPEDYPMLFAVIEYRYGAESVPGETFTSTLYDISGKNILKEDGDAKILMRLPDLRNKYVKGTGVIDGTQLSSPGLAPTYNPTKLSGSPGNAEPGAFGGMWYIDTIGDPGVDELEQVNTPGFGLLAQESEFFGIASIQTTGYSDVTQQIDFIVYGDTTCRVSLKKEKVYDIPLHFHDVVVGQRDASNIKGRVTWGQEGGFRLSAKSGAATQAGTTSDNFNPGEFTYVFNQWGYFINDNLPIPKDRLPKSQFCPAFDPKWWDGTVTTWESNLDSGYLGIDSIGDAGTPDLKQSQMTVGSAAYNEINNYIDVAGSPWVGSGSIDFNGVAGARKAFAALDIPPKSTTVKGWNPTTKLFHNHYLSLSAPFDDDGLMYSHGNFDEHGNKSPGITANDSTHGLTEVDLVFDANADLGIQVLPGEFVLSTSKQLVPSAEFAPQEEVVLVSPYTWTKWLIKAY